MFTNGHSATSAHLILQAEDLRKTYGQRQALRGLSFSLNAGRILGFLGPNGAGKTTSIRILTTMMEPDSGHFTVDGISSKYPDQIRRKIGVLPENLGFPRQMTAIEYLVYFGQLYGQTKAQATGRGLALLENVGLQGRMKSLVGTFSHGMKQRLGIARALINDPAVIFLDEPTLGLDPRGQQELLTLIKRITHERNVGVVLCSHALPEIEAICDEVIILMMGRVISSGSVVDIVGKTNQNLLRILVQPNTVSEAQHVLESLPGIRVINSDAASGVVRLELVEPAMASLSVEQHINNLILQTLISAQIPILSFEAEGNRLQDVFLQLTEEAVK